MATKKVTKKSKPSAKELKNIGGDEFGIATEFAKAKIKSSYYFNAEVEERIVKIYLNRIQKGLRPRKSAIVEEAVALLYKTEFAK